MSLKVSFLYKNMYDDVCKGSRQERERERMMQHKQHEKPQLRS